MHPSHEHGRDTQPPQRDVQQAAEAQLLRIGGAANLPRSLAGGKAGELHRLAVAGFPVPAAVVLTTAFFSPWIARLRGLPAWTALTHARQDAWPAHLAALRPELDALAWDAAQLDMLERLVHHPALGNASAGFAVRSSSPQEDLDNASFAGIYRTVLQVARDDIPHAVRACFASCLDDSVLSYKAAHGMPVFEPAIAVIVQCQVDSEVAGVAFSINPLTNDHDEILVNAGRGLGDAVVDGRVTPDQFILDKASGRMLHGVAGDSGASGSQSSQRTPLERVDEPGTRLCLAPPRLAELASMVARIEALSAGPVDIEFAWAAGTLHVLQCRPVTTWVPLAGEMMSRPGEPRTLYMDAGLSKGLTVNAPISPLGQDWLRHTIASMVTHYAGNVDFTVDRAGGWLYIGGGRMYLNLSRMLWLATPQQLARSNAPTDELMGKALAAIDVARYRSPVRPSMLPLLRVLPRMLWRLRRPLWRTVEALVAPAHAYRKYREKEHALVALLSCPDDSETTLPALQQRLGGPVVQSIVDTVMPAMLAGTCATAALRRLARKGCAVEERLLAQLTRGTEGNTVVAMNIAMFRLARMLPPADFADPCRLAASIEGREVDAGFLAAWDDFMRAHGCRGPGEMDLANPGYLDDPVMLLRQMAVMASAPAANDPEAARQELARQRQEACRHLLARFGPVRRILLRRLHAVSTRFASTRDTPKHINLLARQRLRECALRTGHALVANGYLDNADQIFGLTYADLQTAAVHHPDSLRRLHRERGTFLDLLARQVQTFPALIDSRGRIQRPPASACLPGQLQGIGISPGVARGRVRCLYTAHAARIEPGEILVAFSTDPGWTPLFINAAAVVLEIGGTLQHGALVARELNKPCIVGIADVLGCLHDGQLVEVDGEHGTVRIVDAPA